MALAINAAVYLTNKMIEKSTNGEECYSVDYLKLNKLLYLAQGIMLAKYDKRLFEEDIIVNADGPCISSYHNDEYLGGLDIFYSKYNIKEVTTKIEDIMSQLLTYNREEILNYVVDKYGTYATDDLVFLTKKHQLCVDAYESRRNGSSSVKLSDKNIKEFFEELPKMEEDLNNGYQRKRTPFFKKIKK